jgi:fructosamine-3-kinase
VSGPTRIAGLALDDAHPVGGGDICTAVTARAGARRVFAKTLAGPPDGLFRAEARGLELLRVDDGPPLPEVLAVGDDGLVLSWIEPGRPSDAAAEQLGRALAAMHAAVLPSFGGDDGFIAALPLDNSGADDWPTFYVQRRLAPYLDALDDGDRAAVAAVCEDLAMLALFGAPGLDRLLASYDEVSPLADGWRERVALHQLHPLLVHATLFGGGYGARAARAARIALSAG